MQTFKPIQYLMIAVANAFGLDKITWDERLKWFEDNQNNLDSLLKKAESPAMFFAATQAYRAAKAGHPTGFPISLDATSSGMQILSVLVGDRKAARITNVISNEEGKRMNAYQYLFDVMQTKTKDGKKIKYSDLKQAIMTAFYGSKAVPKEIFGVGHELDMFFETLETEAPHIWTLNKAFLKIWNSKALEYSWTLPDNFHVHSKVMSSVSRQVAFRGKEYEIVRKVNQATPKGRSLGANITHSVDGLIVRELTRRCDFDPAQRVWVMNLVENQDELGRPDFTDNFKEVQKYEQLFQDTGYLSARVLDYIDESSVHLIDRDLLMDLLESLPPRPFRLVSVHDCFRVHPNYGNDLRQQYNLQLALLSESHLLSHILEQVTHKPMRVQKQDSFSKEILEANYALS